MKEVFVVFTGCRTTCLVRQFEIFEKEEDAKIYSQLLEKNISQNPKEIKIVKMNIWDALPSSLRYLVEDNKQEIKYKLSVKELLNYYKNIRQDVEMIEYYNKTNDYISIILTKYNEDIYIAKLEDKDFNENDLIFSFENKDKLSKHLTLLDAKKYIDNWNNEKIKELFIQNSI